MNKLIKQSQYDWTQYNTQHTDKNHCRQVHKTHFTAIIVGKLANIQNMTGNNKTQKPHQ